MKQHLTHSCGSFGRSESVKCLHRVPKIPASSSPKRTGTLLSFPGRGQCKKNIIFVHFWFVFALPLEIQLSCNTYKNNDYIQVLLITSYFSRLHSTNYMLRRVLSSRFMWTIVASCTVNMLSIIFLFLTTNS